MVLTRDVNPRIINLQLLSSHKISYLLLVISTGSEDLGKEFEEAEDNDLSHLFQESDDEFGVHAHRSDDLRNNVEEAADAKSPEDANGDIDNGLEALTEDKTNDCRDVEQRGPLSSRAGFEVEFELRAEEHTHEAVVFHNLASTWDNRVGAPTVLRRLDRGFLSALDHLLRGTTVSDRGGELFAPSVRGGTRGISGPPSKFFCLGFLDVEFPVLVKGLLEKTLLVVATSLTTGGAARFAFLSRDEEGETG